MAKKRADIADDGWDAPPSGKLHKCNACGRESVWGPTWAWYGSYKQQDEGLPVYKACSDECMARREVVEAEMKADASKKELDRAISETESRLARLKRRRETFNPTVNN